MSFEPKKQPYSGKINAVTLGTGDKAIVIGGQNVLPFYTFDAPIENAPKIGVEISDLASEWTAPALKEFYAGCTTMADYAKKAETMEGADFLCLHFESADPNGANRSVADCVADAKAVADEAKSFGTKYVVITGMYRFDYGDEATMHDLAARLNKAGAALKAEGVELLYHNHNCELRRVNDKKRAYDILLEETDPQFVNFEFDSYWFTEGGANALAWMQRLGTRMKPWHINDRGTRISGSAVTPILKTDSMELGTGNMDLDSLMAQALSVGVDAVILESHRNWVDNSPIKSLQLSAEYLKQHG